MLRKFIHVKLHQVTIDQTMLHYTGSLTIPRNVLEASGLLEFEQIDVYNITNGKRFSTYVIAGAPGDDAFCVNGAAARLVEPGDTVIVTAFMYLSAAEIPTKKVRVLLFGPGNRINQVVEKGLLHGE